MKARVVLLTACAIFLTACEFSLAGDVTPPAGAILSNSMPIPVEVEYPPSQPDLASGATIFAESCEPCHGDSGLGDGVQSANLPFPPAPIGTDELANVASPDAWFQIVSQGNLDRYMPPFANQLSVQQRWDAVAYSFSLSNTADELGQGAALFTQHQQAVDEVFPQASDLSRMGQLSRNEIADLLSSSLSGLTSAEASDLATYVQSLYLGGSAVDVATVPGAEVAPEDLGELSGVVVDGTDGELPADLQATLFAYDDQQQAFTASATVELDGSFDFEDVPLAPDRVFFVSVDYGSLSYFSDFLTAEAQQIQLDQPITIYETTSDNDQLAVEKLTLVFEFQDAGVVRVIEQVAISNIGNRAVTPTAEGLPVLNFSLPPEASNLVFNEGTLGDRYVAQESGFGDLRAVLPGTQSYQLLFAYDLPYGSGVALPLRLDLPTRSVLLLLPDAGITVNSDQFLSAGVQQIQGASYQAYVSNGAFSAGDEVDVNLRGANPQGGAGLGLAGDDSLLAGLAALTMAVGLAWLWLRNLQPGPDTLMDQIIALDALYERGDLGKNAYNQKRAALKDRLRRALKEK